MKTQEFLEAWMSNNERRRNGIPMVRWRQHLRNMRNQRRRKGEVKYERRKKSRGISRPNSECSGRECIEESKEEKR